MKFDVKETSQDILTNMNPYSYPSEEIKKEIHVSKYNTQSLLTLNIQFIMHLSNTIFLAGN